mmetsp:Transcript_21040/g.50517  ORF Transcript_21040/g.50517 Transcript_21040/m.50517 type:complete len:296 (-) Transcript_21040:133-1020(-)
MPYFPLFPRVSVKRTNLGCCRCTRLQSFLVVAWRNAALLASQLCHLCKHIQVPCVSGIRKAAFHCNMRWSTIVPRACMLTPHQPVPTRRPCPRTLSLPWSPKTCPSTSPMATQTPRTPSAGTTASLRPVSAARVLSKLSSPPTRPAMAMASTLRPSPSRPTSRAARRLTPRRGRPGRPSTRTCSSAGATSCTLAHRSTVRRRVLCCARAIRAPDSPTTERSLTSLTPTQRTACSIPTSSGAPPRSSASMRSSSFFEAARPSKATWPPRHGLFPATTLSPRVSGCSVTARARWCSS